MWNSETQLTKFRALLHSKCNFPSFDYPRYDDLHKNFVKQWEYVKKKVFLPDFNNSKLKDILQSIASPENKTKKLFENEWHEVLCYVIFIAAFYETEYNAYFSYTLSSHNLYIAQRMSNDCLWNVETITSIIRKYKDYNISLDKKFLIKDFLTTENPLEEFWTIRESFLKVIITENEDQENDNEYKDVEHVFAVQKLDNDNYRLIETNVRSHQDLRHTFFEQKSYGFPYSWNKSTSTFLECEEFIFDVVKKYKDTFHITLFMDFVIKL
tara:strand:+ start:1239 stop:2042 length:804 start_codon:yes stop_codon:yes gene_type:complete